MGQYFIIVNVDKKQYLHPHKFGAGLKLMEFSGKKQSIGQALIVLLAHSHGGGGNLRCDGISDAKLMGSWAGDKIVVAGDYDDPWLFVPDEYKHVSAHFEGYGLRNGKPCDETLYSTAQKYFDDISDSVIKMVAKIQSPYHPWAAIDAVDGWRQVPEYGELPKTDPKNPVAGHSCYEAYKNYVISCNLM